MEIKPKDLTPSNVSLEIDSFNSLYMEKAENNVSDHELDSAPAPEEEAAAQSFSWSLRKVVILSSLCLLTVLSYGALSMIAPFFPHEVSSVIGERSIVK